MRWIANRSRSALLVLVLILCLTGVATLDAQKERFTEETTVVVVELPVQVTLDGEPVRDLTADDFEVLEGGRRQEIVGFDVFDLSLTSAQNEPLKSMSVSASARRHFLLFFDLSFSRPSSIVKARQAAHDLLEDSLHPADLVAVATYSGSGGVKMVLGFTSDRQQATYAIESLGLAQPLARVSDPMALMIAEMQPAMGGIAGGPRGGMRGDAELLEDLRDMRAMSGRAARDQRQNQILALTSSLESMANLLNSVPGRVQVVLLSEGFDSSVMLGNEGLTGEDQARIAEINRAAESGEMWKVDSEERFGSGASLSALDQMLEEFRRADCVIQAVDIGGLKAGGEAGGEGGGRGSGSNRENSLFIMADQTGGEHYRNFNNLGEAMEKLLERTSVTYVLAIQPAALKLDGSYHRVKVKLEDGPKGAQLVHRPGYYAPRPYAEQTGLQRQLAAAGLIMGGHDGGEITTAVLATPFLLPDDKAYVPVLVEVNGADLIGAGRERVVPTELYAYAIDSSGSIGDFLARTMTLDLEKVGPALEQTGFKYWGRLDLAAGDYVIRVLVRNGVTGATGVKTASISVPSSSEGPPHLLPVLVPEPMGKWVMARDQNVESQAYPFLADGTPFIPAARPVVKPGSASAVCLMESGFAGVSSTLSAMLVAVDGETAGEATLELHGGAGQAFPGYECHQATLVIPAIQPGEYRLLVELDDPSVGESYSSEIPVLIDG